MVVGAGAVGKSSLTWRMVSGQFPCLHNDPTIEDSYSCFIDVRGNIETVDILDTAGQEEFCGLQNWWIREADNFILVYSIQSFRTLKYAQEFYRKIMRQRADIGANVVLVGNKSDLNDGPQSVMRSENIKVLVFGYLRQAEKLWNDDKIIPNEIKEICLLYNGKPESRIEVTHEMGQQLAKAWEMEGRIGYKVPFFETSAKTGENVHDAFESLIILSQDAGKLYSNA